MDHMRTSVPSAVWQLMLALVITPACPFPAILNWHLAFIYCGYVNGASSAGTGGRAVGMGFVGQHRLPSGSLTCSVTQRTLRITSPISPIRNSSSHSRV